MGFSDAEPWRIGVLFVVFTAISIVFIKGNHELEAYLRRNKMHALRHVLDAFREELLLLGFISLMLSVFDPVFKKMCVKASSPEAIKNANAYGKNTCPEGEVPFWDSKTLHQTHVFIFILACTHILYACLSMSLCVMKMRGWSKYEAEAVSCDPAASLRPLAERLAPSSLRTRAGAGADGGAVPQRRVGLVRLIWRSFLAQFLDSTNEAVYLDLRRLFMERTGAPQEFDFLTFLVHSIQEDYARIIGTNSFMWALAAVYVMVPQFVFLPASIFTLTLTLVVGTVLESIQLRLTQCSYQLFNQLDTTTAAAVAAAAATTTTNGVVGGKIDLAAALPASAAAAATAPTSRTSLSSERDGESGDRLRQLQLVRTMMAQRLDAADFFWRGKPFYMLRVFQFVLFENAMSMSMLTFSMWQDPKYYASNIEYGWGAVIAILLVDFCIMAHTSVFVLPVYAIASSVGSHSSLTIHTMARKKSVSGVRAMEVFRRQNTNQGSVRGGGGGGALERSGSRARRTSKGSDAGSADDVRVSVDGWSSDTSASASQRRAFGRKWDKHGSGSGAGAVGDLGDDDDGRLSDLEEDYEAENARSLSYLMGAILTKKLNEQRARKRLENIEGMEQDVVEGGGDETAEGSGSGDPEREWVPPMSPGRGVESARSSSNDDARTLHGASAQPDDGVGSHPLAAAEGGASKRQPAQKKSRKKTPSLVSVFSPDSASDGLSELDRMTGGLESCMADAAEVAEAWEAVSPRRSGNLTGHRRKSGGSKSSAGGGDTGRDVAGASVARASDDGGYMSSAKAEDEEDARRERQQQQQPGAITISVAEATLRDDGGDGDAMHDTTEDEVRLSIDVSAARV